MDQNNPTKNDLYVSAEQYDAIVAEQRSRIQAARLRRFAGKRERSYRVCVVVCDPFGGYRQESRTIRGYTKADALEQAGIR